MSVAFERAVDGLVIGHLVVGIGLVEGVAVERREGRRFSSAARGEALAGVVVLRRHAELLAPAPAPARSPPHGRAPCRWRRRSHRRSSISQGELRGLDVDHARRVGDVSDLRIGRSGGEGKVALDAASRKAAVSRDNVMTSSGCDRRKSRDRPIGWMMRAKGSRVSRRGRERSAPHRSSARSGDRRREMRRAGPDRSAAPQRGGEAGGHDAGVSSRFRL